MSRFELAVRAISPEWFGDGMQLFAHSVTRSFKLKYYLHTFEKNSIIIIPFYSFAQTIGGRREPSRGVSWTLQPECKSIVSQMRWKKPSKSGPKSCRALFFYQQRVLRRFVLERINLHILRQMSLSNFSNLDGYYHSLSPT